MTPPYLIQLTPPVFELSTFAKTFPACLQIAAKNLLEVDLGPQDFLLARQVASDRHCGLGEQVSYEQCPLAMLIPMWAAIF